ncbi:elongation factor P 5-aminopentanone reductase [Numidum massiliense]|uniref:elongation factor P 5-aminopentanone reductase n=1 Tax=Numidum massiliense TaxID=1522315 RepID=UPI0006D574F6|nr:SDR family NAD(P)-dependent oxidoreductase [Numidum massiliense]
MRPLSEQVVLVTGASRGIGRAIAEKFSAHGARLALNYLSSHDKAAAVAAHCRNKGSDVLCLAADVRDREAVNRMVQTVLSVWGRIDTVVYNAGISRTGLFQDMSDADYDALMDTHVRGAFHVLQASAPHLLQQKQGRVVVLSSIWGSAGGACEVLYSAAKAALNGLTKALAAEWAPSGITVNAVAPGAVDTDMLQSLSAAERAATAADIPLDRFGTAEEVAHWVLQLCRPESGYMTGQILHVNGGWYTP